MNFLCADQLCLSFVITPEAVDPTTNIPITIPWALHIHNSCAANLRAIAVFVMTFSSQFQNEMILFRRRGMCFAGRRPKLRREKDRHSSQGRRGVKITSLNPYHLGKYTHQAHQKVKLRFTHTSLHRPVSSWVIKLIRRLMNQNTHERFYFYFWEDKTLCKLSASVAFNKATRGQREVIKARKRRKLSSVSVLRVEKLPPSRRSSLETTCVRRYSDAAMMKLFKEVEQLFYILF